MVISSVPIVPAYAESIDEQKTAAGELIDDSQAENATDEEGEAGDSETDNEEADFSVGGSFSESADENAGDFNANPQPARSNETSGAASGVLDSEDNKSAGDSDITDGVVDSGDASDLDDKASAIKLTDGQTPAPSQSDESKSETSDVPSSSDGSSESESTSDNQESSWENVTFTFDDSESKVHLEVIATNQELATQLQDASIRIQKDDEIALLDMAKDLVKSVYGESRDASYLNAELIDSNGTSISLAKDNLVKLSIPSDSADNEILGIIADGSLKKYDQTFDANELAASIEPENFGVFCIVAPANSTEGGDSAEEGEASSPDEVALYDALAGAAAGASNVEAPSSSVDSLEPGIYSVTANLYIPAAANEILGINAYVTNPSNPFTGDGKVPATPVTLNATLNIADDEAHTATLDLDVVNEAFQVLAIGGETNARVTDIQRTGDSVSTDESTGAVYQGRISHITVTLNDLSGHYEFADCVDMPPFGIVYWPLNLDIDFAAISAPVTRHDLTWTDDATGVVVTSSTLDQELGTKLETAKLVVEELATGNETYDAANAEMATWFYGEPHIMGYSVSLISDGGEELQVDSCDNVSVAINFSEYQGVRGYKYIDGTLSPVEDTYVSYPTCTLRPIDGLGTFFIITNYETAAFATQKSWTDSSSGVSVTYHSIEGNGNAPSTSVMDETELQVYVDKFADSTAGTAAAYALQTIAKAKCSAFDIDSASGEIKDADVTIYRLGFVNGTIKNWGVDGKTSMVVTVPVLSSTDELYVIRKGGSKYTSFWPYLRQYSVAGSGRYATFDLVPQGQKRQRTLFNYIQNSIKSESIDTALAGTCTYVVVLHKTSASIMVDKPVVATDLVYNGREQVGVAENAGYTLEGVTKATKANADGETYQATATLNDGYVWSDGTSDPVVLTWSIAKKELTATYAGEQVLAGETPRLAVTVDGFADGENESNAAGYVAPLVAAPTSLEAGKSYELMPEGGAADNYTFAYVSGTLAVVASTSGLKAGTYTVSANVYVPGELNTQLPGVTAYLTNKNNPLGIDGGNGLPDSPVSDNATLVVKSNGKMYVMIPVVNPVFTLQGAGSGDGIAVLGTTRDDNTYSTMTGSVSRQGRITMLHVQLTNASGLYQLADCTEFPTLLGVDWNVPLSVSVDLDGATMQSTDTDVNIPGWTDPDPTPTPVPDPEPGETVVKADAPTANSNLVYNGKTQTGVAASKAYTLTGATAKDAGIYTATATLNEGYEWADGTTAPKTVTYTIAKAKLTATYAGETVVEGAEPGYAVDVAGFVNGETVFTAAGFKAPSVTPVASSQLVAGKSFTLTPAGGEARNYTYIYVAGTLKVTEPAGTIAPGTYQITANLYVPGELNTVLGKNAYLTNASTPLTDGNAPLTPVSDNAKLVVRADGSRVLVIPVVNPVFTLQSVASGENAKVLGTERGGEVVGSTQVSDRVTMLYMELGDDSGSYQLGDCVEFPTLLNQEWNVPLRISADFSSLKKLSSTSTVTIPGQSGTDKPDNGNTGGNGNNQGGNNSGNNGSNNNGNQGNNGSNTNGGDNNQGNNGTGDNNGGQNGNQGTAGNGDYTGGSYRLTAGTYTVTANIWLSDRSATGLPLMTYLTSGDFPPMYPVTGNATLTVDESGHATLRVPITIQSKVMTVSGISGLSVVDTEYSGGYVSAVTIDLGTITDMSGVITRSCSATIVMGSLASTISGITGSHTWPATFQVVFTGVPVSGNAGSSYDWSKAAAVAGNGTLAAGVGALAAEGTGAATDLDFLATATKAASQMAVHGAAGELEAGTAEGTSADFACAGVSNTLTALDPDAASGTDATAALALAAALTGGELELASGAENFEAAFLAGKAA